MWLEARGTLGRNGAATVSTGVGIVLVVFGFLDLRRKVREPLVASGRRLVMICQRAFSLVGTVGPATVLRVTLALGQSNGALSVLALVASLLGEQHHVGRGNRGLSEARDGQAAGGVRPQRSQVLHRVCRSTTLFV